MALFSVVISALIGFSTSAFALTEAEVRTIAGSLDGYVQGGNFLITAADLKKRIKLNEGEDAAQNPVLIDVFKDDYIPGTALRFGPAWQTTVDSANATHIRDKVIAHRSAGFSTDIVVYCLTGHSESPPVMALGAMSYAGFFDDKPGDSKPRVYALKWGRAGWGLSSGMSGTLPNPGYTAARGYTTSSLSLSSNNALANSAPLEMACGGKTGPELVRCAAAWALSPSGGNVGSGILPWAASQDSSYAPVDLRLLPMYSPCADPSSCNYPTTHFMANGPGEAYAVPIALLDLFSPQNGHDFFYLKMLDSTGAKTNFFTDLTQHTAAFAAQGAAMLGYKTAFAKWGLPRWNNTAWTEGQYDRTSAGYSYIPDATPVDSTAPVISSINVSSGETSATFTWTTDEPATSIVDICFQMACTRNNETILKRTHHKIVSGLTCGRKYVYQVISYDGLANEATSAVATFDTSTCTGTPPPNGHTGDINGDGNVDVADALKALRIAVGIDAPSSTEINNGDCAPMANGNPNPDNKIGLDDVVLIMRKAAGLTNWSYSGYDKVFKYRGSIQCGDRGMAPEDMKSELINAGIEVRSYSCGNDGMGHPAVCGAGTGEINVFEISRDKVSQVQSMGYSRLSDYPEARESQCY